MYKLKQTPEDFIVEEIPNFTLKKNGKFTYFLLEKKNYDTEKAIWKISERLNTKRKKIAFSGNKDKIAITKQYCSIEGKISDYHSGDIKIKVIGTSDVPLALGSHKGNKFTITARSLKKAPKKIDWMINYFDEQRFGKKNLEIGFAIIRNDFKRAAELIDLQAVRDNLNLNKRDYIGAIKRTPFKTLNLYMHAVQSFFWNEATAKYIEEKSKKNRKSKYKHGLFIFPENKIANLKLPLVSFDTEFKNPKLEDIYLYLLKKNNISLMDFVIRKIPEITPIGSNRDLIKKIKNLKISKLYNDEINPGTKKITLEFELDKGCYATIAARQMFL